MNTKSKESPEPIFGSRGLVPKYYLEANDVFKSHGDTAVLNGISLGVEKGECLALLGPSGCGKSTLLNILAGLIPADRGRISLDGRTIEDVSCGQLASPQQRRFSMVFQDLSLWPHMTVEENVVFGLDYLKLSRREKQERVENVLKLVGMHAMRERLPAQLSGGQQQRVAIARAIVVEPSVLLLDEPLAALDTKLREALRDEIAALIRRLGITTIYVTHDHTEAMTVAHRVAIMNAGQFEQIASPHEIYNYPQSTFVASFLGCASFVPFTYEMEDLRDRSGTQIFPSHPPGKHRGFLLIRREQVKIFSVAQAEEFPGDGMIRWRGTCIKNSFIGASYEVHAKTRKGEVFRALAQEPIPLDAAVYIQFDPHEVLLVEK